MFYFIFSQIKFTLFFLRETPKFLKNLLSSAFKVKKYMGIGEDETNCWEIPEAIDDLSLES
jgi:hypothetical protein